MLSCDPNRPVLERLVENQTGLSFRYVASEFPILTDEGYGFIDAVGIGASSDSVILLECKSDASLADRALTEAAYYQDCIRSHGLLQEAGLLGVYHRAILGHWVGRDVTSSVRPLLLTDRELERISGPSMSELFLRYRDFMVGWMARSYGVSVFAIREAAPSDSVPIYVLADPNGLEKRDQIYYLSFSGSMNHAPLSGHTPEAPLKIDPDKTHYETLQRIENKRSHVGGFSIQVNLHGHSRPMLLLEIDDAYSACFIHVGVNKLEMNGYYESKQVLSGKERMYGLVEAERGKYRIAESSGSRVNLQLFGQRCSGDITLNFLDNIYLEADTIDLYRHDRLFKTPIDNGR